MQQYFPIEAGFLGPKAEHGKTWTDILNYILQDYIHWRRNYFPEDEQILDRATRRSHEGWFDILSNELDKVLNQLKADYPFYSPRYQGHMVSENLVPGVVGYFAGMLYNPNNVSSESAPITLNLELEAGHMIAAMPGVQRRQKLVTHHLRRYHSQYGGSLGSPAKPTEWSGFSGSVPALSDTFRN